MQSRRSNSGVFRQVGPMTHSYYKLLLITMQNDRQLPYVGRCGGGSGACRASAPIGSQTACWQDFGISAGLPTRALPSPHTERARKRAHAHTLLNGYDMFGRAPQKMRGFCRTRIGTRLQYVCQLQVVNFYIFPDWSVGEIIWLTALAGVYSRVLVAHHVTHRTRRAACDGKARLECRAIARFQPRWENPGLVAQTKQAL